MLQTEASYGGGHQGGSMFLDLSVLERHLLQFSNPLQHGLELLQLGDAPPMHPGRQ